MTWDEVHARHRLGRELLRQVEQAADLRVIDDRMADITSTFGSLAVFLKHVEHLWTLQMHVRMDGALERGVAADRHAICEVVARQEPGMKLLLQHYEGHVALRDSPVVRTIAQLRPPATRTAVPTAHREQRPADAPAACPGRRLAALLAGD